ncbi:MAG: LPS export ABC transporter periplasmic protein LptC [Leptolyngbyaceae cyanobacterium bins.59]|nr:LPS export ABC transporter periplasmic protein LptC [Leptolyngbyaceae cyanobacterium bins.59]
MKRLLLLLLLLSSGACSPKRAADQLAKDSATVQATDGSLTFKDVTLQQFDDQGRLLWKVKAKQARYSEDQKIAKIQDPTGELFQDGKLVFQITALQGEVQQDGKKIFLKDKIVATDIRDKVVLRGQELEWLPQKDTLIVRKNLTGTHAQVNASAQEARAFSRARRVEFVGQVVAVTKDPALRLRAEKLLWQLPQQLITSDRPIQVDRYEKQQVSDRASGGRAEVNLKEKTAKLQQNAQVFLISPPVTIGSQALLWNLKAQRIVSEQPITVQHREQQVVMLADRGQLDLTQRIFYFMGNARARGRDQAQLSSSTLTWLIPKQEVQAEGDVRYRQPNPPFNLTGPQAVGKLQDQTIVISGGRVVTEIIP